MFCSNCGKELPENANFCYACGSPVTKPESETKEVKESSEKEVNSTNPTRGALKLKPAKTKEIQTNNLEAKKESEKSKTEPNNTKISSIKIASDTNNTNLKAGSEKPETSNTDTESKKPKTAKDFYLSKKKENINVKSSTNQEKYPNGFKGRRTLGGLPGTRTASKIPGNLPVYSKDNSSSSDNKPNSETAKLSNVDLSSFKTPASQPSPSGSSSNITTNTKKPVTMGMKLGVFVAIFLGAVMALSFLYIGNVARSNMRSSSSSSYSSDNTSDYSDDSYSSDSDSSSSSSYSSDSYSTDDDTYTNISTIYASSAQWPFYDYFMRDNFSASSSSYLMNSGSITYNPSNVTDNDSKTAWVANRKGSDVGEYLNLYYDGDSDFILHRLYFLNGYTKDMETFNKNTTPTELDFGINGDKIATLKLMADPNPQVIELETPITLTTGDTLNFEINQAQTGPNDSVIDTAISDIRVE